MAAKKKTAKVNSADVATATKAATASAKATTKKKATAKKKAVAKTTATKKKATAKKVMDSKEEVVAETATSTAAPKKKAAAKKTPAKKASAKKAPAKKRTSSDGQFKTFEPYKTTKGEEYMNENQQEHFREILLNWKISLMEEVDRTVGHMKNDATNFPDPNDRATQEEEFSLELRTRDRERKLIKKIDESITKLDEDDYGYCDGCGVDIGIRRLEARPTANMCIECKTLEEIREKQIA